MNTTCKRIAAACITSLFFAAGPASAQLKPLLENIEKTKTEIKQAETNVQQAQAALTAREPDLAKERDKKNAEAASIQSKHDNKYPPGSSEYAYWNGLYLAAADAAKTAQNQIDELRKDKDDAVLKKEEAEDRLSQYSAQLLLHVQQNSKADCAKQLSSSSTIEAIVQCWNCFFDGGCGDYGPAPVDGRGFRITPNGAPEIFKTFRNTQLEDIAKGIRDIKVPLPPPPPPQKNGIREAAEKIRGYFREVIENSRRLRQRITTAVVAVRG